MMRWKINYLSYVLFFGFLFVLWLLVSYTSFIDVPRPFATSRVNPNDIINRLEILELNVAEQLAESSKLLTKVRKHLKKHGEGVVKEDLKNVPVPTIPVLVIACDRITVKRCLDNLIKYRPANKSFPIIVSQDCGHEPTYEVIKSYVDKDPSISVVKQPDQSAIQLQQNNFKFRGYYKIARHFKFALNHVLDHLGYEATIIIEDDLDIAPDLFEYFQGTYPLLIADPSLWCVSAWNDNGKQDLINMDRPELLHRTDFFPGLGWMLRQSVWLELRDNWPKAFFDDWLRNPVNVKNRACIRPEVSRTYSFGKVGVSRGLYFDKHLRFMQLNTRYTEFTKLDLTYLLKENYDPWLATTLGSLPQVSAEVASKPGESDVVVPYDTAASYLKAARTLGLMDDFRSGVPRTAYRGVVNCFIEGRRVYLAPHPPWERYRPDWG